jgi:basic membrane lipoprotein Med (substrate-binding protein (PBP1-ABC) superfamily)
MSVAFAEGVKAENPAVEVRYAVIGPAAYADAAGGKRVTETVIASGADVIFGQGNGSSFGMLQAVETTKAKTKNVPDDVWAQIEAIKADIVAGKIVVEPKYDADSVHKLVKTVQ